jgi:SprT protein
MQRRMNKKVNTPESFFPSGSYTLISSLFNSSDLEIRIVKSRSTKFADFNPPGKNNKLPVITINDNLNPYLFLITFLHEFAHFLAWKEGKFYAKPHGRTWKNHFRELMQKIIGKEIFPENLISNLKDHILNPRATSCTDTRLYKILSTFDTGYNGVFIDEIPDRTFFHTSDGQLFYKEKKVRKRILCITQKSKKKYLFSPIYKIFPVKDKQFVIVFP